MKKLADWFDDRTGYRTLVRELLYERIPGGARWRYVWGSTLVFLFATQAITGLFLWMAYSPSAQTAFESVYYIQYSMQAGWLLRGIHHYAAQAMIVALVLHLLQVVWYGAYRPPREINWVLGILLMLVVLGLSLTGYLLPWDQKGYWATQVATKIAGVAPGIGAAIQDLIVGGPEYGHHTLTRFFALHAGLLPALLLLLLVAHVAIFRRHGVTAPRNAVGEQMFWPHQVLRDSVACLAVLAGVLYFVLRNGGAELGAPADPSEPYSAARPEWYFLFLFQLLKYFPGESEVIGAIVIPTLVFLVLLLLPWIGRPAVGHAFSVTLVTALVVGAGYLTYTAAREDRLDKDYKNAVELAEQRAQRVVELAQGLGIGDRGAVALLREDPKTQGPIIFSQNCAGCHRWDGHDGTGRIMDDPQTCSDLGKFGTMEWIKGFITDPAGPKYFGTTKNNLDVGDKFVNGPMAKWAAEYVPKMTPREIDAVAAFLLAQSQRDDIPAPPEDLVKEGREFFELGSELVDRPCLSCHRMNVPDMGPSLAEVPAPDLTAHASEDWLKSMILHPDSERHYGKRNEMPPYREGKISEQQLNILLGWMRHRWYEPGAASQAEEPKTPPTRE